MPIVFRCAECGQKLSVSRRKAGQPVDCPQCAQRIQVPELDPAALAEEQDQSTSPTQAVRPNLPASATRERDEPRNPWLDEEHEEPDFKLSRGAIDDEGLDMTPMVDVTFLLLIFFMITASFAIQKSMQTTPPQPEEEGVSQNVQEDVEDESVIVEIDAENNIRVDDVAVAGIGELIDVLTGKRAGEGKTDMMIEAHELSKHGTVVAVTDAGLEADMQRIRRKTTRSED